MGSFSEWLREQGLGRYESVLRDNDVDFSVAGQLSENDLRELGLTLGHRKKFLVAVAALNVGNTLADALQTQGGIPPAADVSAGTAVGWVQPTEPSAQAKSEAVPEGERRQVTVLFSDLVGSTALSNVLDPEAYLAVMGRYHETAVRSIQRFDGYVQQIQGDGIVAYFGYPIAHEGEADRAIRAGLAIVEGLTKVDVGAHGPLQVRIGIASGLVVMSHVFSPEKSAVGETPNMAQRMQTVAKPGEVMVSERAKALAGGGFDYEDRGRHQLKGIAGDTRVWKVIGESAATSRFDAATRGQLTPMVGRDQEIGLLLERWELARAGEGQVVLLSGEPGIGKSRMLRAFREAIDASNPIALQYQCSPYYTNTALYPIIEHLERSLAFQRDDSLDQKLDKLEARLIAELGRSRTDCQLIGEMLSLPCEAHYGKLNLSPQRQKDDTLRALAEIIAVIAQQQPTVVLFEDLHWADPTTMEALTVLIDRAEALPVLVLFTYRPEFQPPWGSRPHLTPITLTRLSRAQGASIVLRVADNKPLPQDLVTQIVDKTDGVPLFLEELTKAVLESDMLIDAGERYDYSGSVSKIAIPATLHDSLMARLDRLIPVKEIAQVGAALGREFSYELLSAVSPMPEPELTEALNKLVQSELVFRRGTPPNLTFVFKHALVQDAAYDSLLKVKRQTLHAQIAKAIEQRFPNKADTEPELLAHHYTEAGDIARAAPLWLLAGQRALARVALAEAIGHLNKALSTNSSLPQDEARDRQELEIRLLLGTTYLTHEGHGSHKVLDALQPARNLAYKLGHDDHLVPILFHLWMIHTVHCRFETGLELVEELHALAKRTGHSYCYVVACNVENETHCWMGNFRRARDAAERGLKAYDPEQHAHLVNTYNHDQRCGILVWMVHFLWILGYPDQAQKAAQEQVDWARQLGHVFNLCFSLTQGNIALTFRGETEQARVWAAEADRIGSEHAMGYVTEFFAPVYDSYAKIEAGEFVDGHTKLRRYWDTYGRSGATLMVPLSNMMSGTALIGLKRFDEARALMSETLALIQQTGHRMHEAEIYRLMGEAYPADAAASEQNFLKALAVSRAQSAKGFELRAAMSLAQLWQQQGKQREARELLAPIYDWFTEGFDTRDLKEARNLLTELNSPA